MESGAEPRDRIPEGDPILSSNNWVIREVSSMDHSVSPGGSARPSEKKREHHSARGSIVPSSHHRAPQSSSGGAIDLQAVVGRSSSSISGVTVPIRLDALSYLLNNAVMANHRMPAQMPYYPQSHVMYPNPQMGYSPFGTCMGSQCCAPAFPNQYPAYQGGFMPCGNQQPMQATQPQVPNLNQYAQHAQSGMTFNSTEMPLNSTRLAFTSAGTPPAQNISGTAQSESSQWAKKPSEKDVGNERSGSNWSNPISSESEKQSSPRRDFGDNKNEDSWSSRQQFNSFGRGSSRGRGNFGGSSWRGNSRGPDKEWSFGERSRYTDFGNKRRFNENTESFQDRESFSKQFRWPAGRGRGESSEPWQQNRQKDPPIWPSTKNTPGVSNLGIKATVTSSAKEEDWETDYPEETTTSKAAENPEKPDLQVSESCSPKNNAEHETVTEVPKITEDHTEASATNPEEPQQDSSTGKGTAEADLEAEAEEKDSTSVISVKCNYQDSFKVNDDGKDINSFFVEVCEEGP